MKEFKFFVFIAFLHIVFISWAVNIYKLCFVESSIGILIARAVGIFMFPLGSVLGFF